MKDFDISKYLKEHQLGPYGILGGYVDLQPLKETDEAAPQTGGEMEEGFGDEWDPSKPSMKSQKALQRLQNLGSPEDIEQDTEMGGDAPNIGRDRISAAIEALSNAGFSAEEIQSILNQDLAFE